MYACDSGFLPIAFYHQTTTNIHCYILYYTVTHPKYQVSKPLMATSTELPTLKELEDTVRAAIDALKQYPEFGSAKLAIIGGTALWKYIPSGRTTKARNNLSS